LMAGRRTDGMPGWLVAAARTVRSSGRLSAASHRAVEGIQGNRAVVGVATRVLRQGGGVPVILLKSGSGLAGVEHPERLPVVIVDAAGVPVEGIAALLAQVAELQEQTQGFRPVLLLSVPAFAEVRAYGWPVELVVNEADWDFEQDWADHVTLRLAMMQTRYQAWATVAVVDGELAAGGVRLLRSLEFYRPWEASPT
ncbi:MAG: hypothetical protein WBP28_06925, partial [Nostocoides sp.]